MASCGARPGLGPLRSPDGVLNGLLLDAGALIALDRNDRAMAARLVVARARGLALAVPTTVISQVWRNGRTQARLARFLAATDLAILPLDDALAKKAGQLCGLRGTKDPIDASVVICARERGFAVLTSDIDDLSRLDPRVRLVRV